MGWKRLGDAFLRKAALACFALSLAARVFALRELAAIARERDGRAVERVHKLLELAGGALMHLGLFKRVRSLAAQLLGTALMARHFAAHALAERQPRLARVLH